MLCVCVCECVHIKTLKTLKYYLLSLVGKIMSTSLVFSSVFYCFPSFLLWMCIAFVIKKKICLHPHFLSTEPYNNHVTYHILFYRKKYWGSEELSGRVTYYLTSIRGWVSVLAIDSKSYAFLYITMLSS